MALFSITRDEDGTVKMWYDYLPEKIQEIGKWVCSKIDFIDITKADHLEPLSCLWEDDAPTIISLPVKNLQETH